MAGSDPSWSGCPTPKRHKEMLVIACLVIGASFALQVQSGEQVGVIGVTEFVLPPLCLAREWFGICCPGCGLTRSFIHLARGDWSASWQAHRLGWLLAALILLQIPYRIHGLCRRRKPLIPPVLRTWIGHCLI